MFSTIPDLKPLLKPEEASPEVEMAEPEVPEQESQPTNLVLDEDQEQALVDRAIDRINEVAREMGLELNGAIQPDSWMSKRERNQLSYDNDLEWRKGLGGIFATGSNFTTGSNRRYARLLSARVRDDLLGTRPFFGAMSENGGDAKLTKQVESFVQERVDNSTIPEALREALRVALVRNEAVVKTTYLVDQTKYKGPARVAVAPDGNPIRTEKGFYVLENDDLVPDPDTEGLFRLKKDPSFAVQPGVLQFQNFPALEQVITHYDNVQSEVLDYRDFLCPLKCRSVHQADINVHLYEETVERLRGVYGGLEKAEQYFGSTAASTGQLQYKEIHGEQEERNSRVVNRIKIAEVYMRCDADGDGFEEEVMLVLDLDNGKAIWYDYLGNHMSQRPFAVIPGVERVPGRWYGVGVFSKMYHSQLYIDTQFNRMNSKDSQSNCLTFRDPSAVKQWRNGAPMKVGTTDVYDLEPGFNASNPPVFRVNLVADAQLDSQMMGLMQQQSDLEFAVISARDASASGLNQSGTATGVMSVERDANVVTKDTEQDHVIGIQTVLEQAVELILEHMDTMQLMFSEDGSELVTLNKDEIRALERKVRLLLTRTRSAEMLATNAQAEAIWIRYMRLTPLEQYHGRALYVSQLKGLEIDNADALLPEVSKEEADAWVKAQSEAKPPQEDKPPYVAVSYKDAPPSIQRQIEQDAGYQPASPEEAARIQAAKDATLVAKLSHNGDNRNRLPRDRAD